MFRKILQKTAIEIAQSLSILVLIAASLFLLMSFAELESHSGQSQWWLFSATGQSLIEIFVERAPMTLGLVIFAFALSTLFSFVTLVFCAQDYQQSWFFWVVSSLSCAPVFVIGYLFVAQQPPFFFAILTLAFGDWNFGALSSELSRRYHTLVRSPALKAVRARGGSVLKHLRSHAILLITEQLRDRIPMMFAASVVVERLFNLPGLGDEAIRSVLDYPDPVFLVWFALFIAVLTRLSHGLHELTLTLLRPKASSQSDLNSLQFKQSAQINGLAQQNQQNSALAKASLTFRTVRAQSQITSQSLKQAKIPTPTILLLLRWLTGLGVLVIVAALLASLFYSEQAETIHAGISSSHLMGTDGLGRDVFIQIGLGVYHSAPFWLLAIALPLMAGSITAFFAVYSRAAVVFDYLARVFDCLPKLVLILILVAIFGVDHYLSIALPTAGLLFFSEVHLALSERIKWLIQNKFIEAEYVLGLSALKVFFVHVLNTHARSILIRKAIVIFAGVLLLDTSCGYLELAQRDLYAWGALVSDNAKAWTRLSGTGLDFNPLSFWAPLTAITVTLTFLRLNIEVLNLRESWLLGET